MPRALLPALLLGLLTFASGARAENLFTAFGAVVVAPSQAAPDFRLPRLDGSVTSLTDYAGRVVLINFWATWCGPCRDEMPGLDRLASRYHERGLTILAVNEDTDGGVRAARFAARHHLSYPILLDRDGEAAKRYHATGLPMTVLVAPDGRLVASVIGERDWDSPAAKSLIESVLDQPR